MQVEGNVKSPLLSIVSVALYFNPKPLSSHLSKTLAVGSSSAAHKNGGDSRVEGMEPLASSIVVSILLT
jgi:hypothetical protein